MIKLTIGATLVAAALFSNTALAEHANIKPKAHDSLGKCVKSALAKHDGTIVKLNSKTRVNQACMSSILNRLMALHGILNATRDQAK